MTTIYHTLFRRVIINDLKRDTYFASLVLSAENESQEKKIIEIDSRPSDCIEMATQQAAPIYVSRDRSFLRMKIGCTSANVNDSSSADA